MRGLLKSCSICLETTVVVEAQQINAYRGFFAQANKQFGICN